MDETVNLGAHSVNAGEIREEIPFSCPPEELHHDKNENFRTQPEITTDDTMMSASNEGWGDLSPIPTEVRLFSCFFVKLKTFF